MGLYDLLLLKSGAFKFCPYICNLEYSDPTMLKLRHQAILPTRFESGHRECNRTAGPFSSKSCSRTAVARKPPPIQQWHNR